MKYLKGLSKYEDNLSKKDEAIKDKFIEIQNLRQ